MRGFVRTATSFTGGAVLAVALVTGVGAAVAALQEDTADGQAAADETPRAMTGPDRKPLRDRCGEVILVTADELQAVMDEVTPQPKLDQELDAQMADAVRAAVQQFVDEGRSEDLTRSDPAVEKEFRAVLQAEYDARGLDVSAWPETDESEDLPPVPLTDEQQAEVMESTQRVFAAVVEKRNEGLDSCG